jgi:hypothetical protein
MGSSRRSASDVNILAMLDGLGSRPHGKRTMLWYGAGGVLVCGLIGTVAWLAHEPATHLDSTMVAGGLPPAPIVAAAASAPPAQLERVSEPLPAPTLQPAGGATIVNVDNDPPPASASATLASKAPEPPPLRILPAPRPAPAVHTPALHTPAPKTVAARVPPTRSAHPVVAHASPKRSAPAIRPLPAPAAVDTDVALISAIIQHAANRHEAVDDSGCHDKPCGPRMPPQP